MWCECPVTTSRPWGSHCQTIPPDTHTTLHGQSCSCGCWNCILDWTQKLEERGFIFNRDHLQVTPFPTHLYSIADSKFLWTHFTSCGNTAIGDHYTNCVQENKFGHFLVENPYLGWQGRLVRPAGVSKVKTALSVLGHSWAGRLWG